MRDRSARRGDDPRDRLDEASSCPRRWRRRRRRTRPRDVEVDVVQHLCATAAQREVADLDERRASVPGLARARGNRVEARDGAASPRAPLRSSSGVSGSGSSAKPAARSRSAASAEIGSQTPSSCSSSARAAQHVVDRSVGDDDALGVEHDDPIDEADGGIEIVLDEQDGAVAGRDELAERGVHLFDARGDRGSRWARPARAAVNPSRGRTRSRAAGDRRPRGGRGSRRDAPRARRDAVRPRRVRARRRRASAGSPGPKATSSSSVPVTSCASGSWNTIATWVVSSATDAPRVSRPATSTRARRASPAPRAARGR